MSVRRKDVALEGFGVGHTRSALALEGWWAGMVALPRTAPLTLTIDETVRTLELGDVTRSLTIDETVRTLEVV